MISVAHSHVCAAHERRGLAQPAARERLVPALADRESARASPAGRRIEAANVAGVDQAARRPVPTSATTDAAERRPAPARSAIGRSELSQRVGLHEQLGAGTSSGTIAPIGRATTALRRRRRRSPGRPCARSPARPPSDRHARGADRDERAARRRSSRLAALVVAVGERGRRRSRKPTMPPATTPGRRATASRRRSPRPRTVKGRATEVDRRRPAARPGVPAQSSAKSRSRRGPIRRTTDATMPHHRRPHALSAMLVAIDGPAGAGKSTVARAVARALGFTYLDSGAHVPRRRAGRDARAIRARAGDPLRRRPRAARRRGRQRGDPHARDLRGGVAAVAADPTVRAALVDQQRALIARGDWVAEGRDIGTVVAPDAEVKVFLTADERRARAARRRAGAGRRGRRRAPSATSATPAASTRRWSRRPTPSSVDTTGPEHRRGRGARSSRARGGRMASPA